MAETSPQKMGKIVKFLEELDGQTSLPIEIRGLLKKRRFIFPVAKSPTQIGSLSVKNPSKKFSRFGTFKQVSVV
jgi:hypothetical protein